MGNAIPHNACGRIGAYLSSSLLEYFGLGSFFIPFGLFFGAVALHRQMQMVSLVGVISGVAAAVGSLTVFLALHWKLWSYGGGTLLTGGVFGTWFAEILRHQLNIFGSSILAILIFCVSLAVWTPFSVVNAAAHLFRILGRLCRLAATYMIYVIGTAVAKLAHKLGNRVQKGIGQTLKKSQVKEKEVIAWVEPVAAAPVKKPEPVSEPIAAVESQEEQEEEISEIHISDLLKSESPSKEAEPTNGSKIAIMPRQTDPASDKAPKISRPVQKTKRGNWQLPTVEFLKQPPKVESSIDREKLISNSQILKQKFADFGIDGEVTAVRPGPVITLYEFKPGPGVKVSRIAALADDLSMALSAQSVRILAPLPGKSVVGIEIPSDTRETVYLREFLQHPDFYGTKHSIPIVMGKDIGGQTYLSDLARMPHLLCAGQTGSGKSVFMNGLICSLFYRFTPDELRMILVDPKFIEFRAYQDIPHLLLPVVDDPKQASTALKWAVREMERRYRILAKIGARNLASYNQKIDEMGSDVVGDLLFSEENQTETPTSVSGGDWIEAFEPDESGAPRVSKLPNIVVIIDELADLMMIAKKEVEISIARIAQKARAAGIHLVIATQRPSTDVITGLIKANLPSRVSFQLASYVDSKTILDRAGAERLLGQGDMLFIPPGVSQSLRLHGAYLDDDEIHKITSFLKSQGKPSYRDEILLAQDDEDENDSAVSSDDDDALFEEAVELVKRSGHASASFLQRHFKVGYNRAARMIETMEARGIVGPQDGARPREVLMR